MNHEMIPQASHGVVNCEFPAYHVISQKKCKLVPKTV